MKYLKEWSEIAILIGMYILLMCLFIGAGIFVASASVWVGIGVFLLIVGGIVKIILENKNE